MEGKKITIGVLGTANIATRSIIPNILEFKNKFELVGIASRQKSKAVRTATKFGTNFYHGYDKLLSIEELDAIYIPLPNSLHFEWIDKALEGGVNVLVEKSLACMYNDVKFLNQRAKEKKLVLLENFQFRFHSQLQYILEIVESGKLGELRCVRSSFGFPPFSDKKNIRYQKELGGGALLDAGAYPIKISQIFLGKNSIVSAAKLSMDAERGIDIWGGAFMKQLNGNLFSEIAFGFDHYYQCSIELWGNQGKLFTNRIFTANPLVAPEIVIETRKGKELITIEPDNHFKNMLNHFYSLCIGDADREEEYIQNINQARLISELKEKAEIG